MFNPFKRNSKQYKNLEKTLSKSNDYKHYHYQNNATREEFTLTFLSTLVDDKIVQRDVLPNLLEKEIHSCDDVKRILPIQEVEVSDDSTKVEEKVLNGYIIFTLKKNPKKLAFIEAKKEISRGITVPEVEFSVVGPKEAFVESLNQNLNLLRKRLPIKELVVEEIEVGKLSKSKVAVLYIDGIANEEDIATVKQRIQEIEYDNLTDSSYIDQIIADNHNSPFPQFLDTERPDRMSAILGEGKVAVMVDGSPHALIAPTTFVEFFGAFEDYFLNWTLASFFRLLRFFAVTFSILVTPVYVAVLTFHYELIPQDLIGLLVTSRRQIPFPPILEALFLELVIELLREAGARLPTKVGQTIGIVGGIVIGTASVEAGLTSNILLIFVALAALASFTTPVYRMGNTIRVLRFPFLIFANFWGLLGIVFCFCILLTHLIRLTSLGRPYLEPIFPIRVQDLKDSLVRLPFSKQSTRPFFVRPKDKKRFSKEKANKKKDIDE